ncbi:3-deoxy-D-manno-octulosonic acid transferase [Echinicola strongylocentroti]|uniref:3-deoxy-D-manno-octulosonic acid transferase n=1 Tax=Echinicola strongylocentroti TaxID=1795355 RepID=A0A2Z4ILT6_9BACT|nr:glycosyltransferase N-terminal domain-containing protein [Echinicola strongylocentroti]AWW31353.1 3-deoxy-D-manno-octulosonic acid transferase [Echinicola strongylocentroti]
MKVIYDFSVWAFSGMLRLASGGDSKLARLVKGRKPVFDEVAAFKAKFPGKVAWFHVASLGEYEQAKPVIAKLKKERPSLAVLVTFFSPSGYENVVKKPQPNVDGVTYLPFDTQGNARQFLELVKPSVVFFVKYDLWANFIFEAKKRDVPLFLFSASLRREQVYFQFYGGFFRKVLKCFDHIYTQNVQTQQLLQEIGISQTTVTGDTRYDNVQAISQSPKVFPEIEALFGDKKVMVVGSAWQEDMDVLLPFVNSHADYHFIIAPHDIDEGQIAGWQKQIKHQSINYSELTENSSVEVKVLFIDNIGMLSSLYQYARVAYVGGAFGKGLHNILEPLAFYIPVLFGKLKKVNKFPEAGISQQYGCGFEVENAEAFEKIVLALEEKEAYAKAVDAAERLVTDNLGSADKIIKGVLNNVQWNKKEG